MSIFVTLNRIIIDKIGIKGKKMSVIKLYNRSSGINISRLLSIRTDIDMIRVALH